MAKISIKNINAFKGAFLSREQLKKVNGGFSSLTGCTNSQGGCDVGDNCARSGGAPDKCSLASGSCKCGS